MAGQAAEIVKAGAEKAAALAKYTEEQVNLLRNYIAPGFDDGELSFFLAVAEAKKLNPFTRQIHAIKRKTSQKINGVWTETFRVDATTGIDGYRSIAARCGDYAPGTESIATDKDGKVVSATVSCKKFVHGQWIEFSATAYFEEYAPYYQKNGQWELPEMWRRMPRSQLTKCAEARALRKGWPEPLADIYVDEEMARAQDEQPSGQFAALQEHAPAALPAQTQAPAPQVMSAPPPAAAKPAQPQAQVLDMQAARAEQQRPASRQGEALPEVWAVTDPIPASILLWLYPLAGLVDKPVAGLALEELELVIETVKRGYNQAKGNPRTSERLLKLLALIAASAQATYDRKMGQQAAAETHAPPFSDADMPVGA